MVRGSLSCHDNEMIQEQAPSVQACAEAVDVRLLESVLGKESEKLKDRKERIELHPLQVGGDKPVEEITTLGQIPM